MTSSGEDARGIRTLTGDRQKSKMMRILGNSTKC